MLRKRKARLSIETKTAIEVDHPTLDTANA